MNLLCFLFLLTSRRGKFCSPEDGYDPVAEEITLVKNMLVAAAEERFQDAG